MAIPSTFKKPEEARVPETSLGRDFTVRSQMSFPYFKFKSQKKKPKTNKQTGENIQENQNLLNNIEGVEGRSNSRELGKEESHRFRCKAHMP